MDKTEAGGARLLGNTMTICPAETPAATVEDFVARTYGIRGDAERIPTERDEQFCLRESSGRRHILKISNPYEDLSVIDLQTAALRHIEAADADLPTPRVSPTLSGELVTLSTWSKGAPVAVRLLSYLPGTPLSEVGRSRRQAGSLGETLARLGLALKSFRHAAESRELEWDLARAGALYELAGEIDGPSRAGLAQRQLERFLTQALPALTSQRSQFVHNDFNPFNILVATETPDCVTGILDFGDAVRTQLINDVAIGASYWIPTGSDPLEYPLTFVAGYHRQCPLQAEELCLIPALMAARLAVTVAVTEWRARRFPENRKYITKNTSAAWQALELLDAGSPKEMSARFLGLI